MVNLVTLLKEILNYKKLKTLMPDRCIIVGGLLQIQSIFSMHSLLLSRKKYLAVLILLLRSVTTSQVRSNTQILQNFIYQDQAYLFLKQIPGSPRYWRKFIYEVQYSPKLMHAQELLFASASRQLLAAPCATILPSARTSLLSEVNTSRTSFRRKIQTARTSLRQHLRKKVIYKTRNKTIFFRAMHGRISFYNAYSTK